MSKQLVTLRTRPSRNGLKFTYFLDYLDENSKRQRISLGHANKRKAQRLRDQKERELRMGIIESGSMKLSKFLEDSLERTRGQVRESTMYQTANALNSFIKAIGDIDYKSVKHQHGECFVQFCLDNNNTPATVAKKLRHLKRLFQLAVQRGQLENNPLKWIKQPRSPKKKVKVLSDKECMLILNAAENYHSRNGMNWLLLVNMALCTGMRRGELLNTVWQDIDFENRTVDVAPKADTEYTWQWYIKDTDIRNLPLTDHIIDMLTKHQSGQTEGHPYLFVPEKRYITIQQLRRQDKWSVKSGCNPMNNFDRQFKKLLALAGVKGITFHDFRRTCLTNWFRAGLREHDVMTMAGHANFETTRQFYLGVADDLVARTRQASEDASRLIFGTHLARTPLQAESGGIC